MTRTEKPYLLDSYAHDFEANVRRCDTDADGTFVVVLDRTYFYPLSGGQLPDRGSLGNATVTDVWEDDAETVRHRVDREVAPGPVKCEVDWAGRFDHMQQHTGQHVLSRAFIDVAGLETVSFHMGEEYCSIDLEGGPVDAGVLQRAEELANRIVWENRPVLVRVVAPEDVDAPLLRKAIPEGVSEVRLVEVEGFDVIGCCGTHVRSTGELGLVKVLRFEKAKGATRVSFNVGRRAWLDYRMKHDVVTQVANRFTTSVEALEGKLDKLAEEAQEGRKNTQRMIGRLAAIEAERLLAAAQDVGPFRVVSAVLDDADDDLVRRVAANLKKSDATVAVLGSPSGLVVCNASVDVAVDFADVVERAKASGGRGGGKGGFASVQLAAGEDVALFVRATVAWAEERGRAA